MILIPKKQFAKHYKKLDKDAQSKVDDTLELFMESPTHYSLNNHKLSGELSKLRSINVTWDYRIWIHQLDEQIYEIVELIDVGTHSQLYW